MLVAGAALSLITPLAVQASDINFEGMNSYSRKAKKHTNKRFDSKSFVNQVNEKLVINNEQDAQQNNFEAGSFSETTVMGGSAVFAVAGIKNADDVKTGATESIQTMYTYTMDLNTSFTGDDNLYVRLRTGNGIGGSTSFG